MDMTIKYYELYYKYKKKYLNLRTKINMLNAVDSIANNKSKTFEFVDIVLTKKEKITIKNLKISHPNEFNYFGKINSDYLRSLIEDFFKLMDEHNESDVITNILFDRIIKTYINVNNADSLWLTIRASEPNTLYNVQRWHKDGYYFKIQEYGQLDKYQLKMAGTLIGPGTMFKSDDPNLLKTLVELRRQHYRNFDFKNFDHD